MTGSASEVTTLQWDINVHIIIIRRRRSRSAAAYSRQTFRGRSVGRSVCPVHCGKTADRIRQQFGIKGRTGPGMRQVVGFGYRSTGRGYFWGEFGARHCNQWGLYGVLVRQRPSSQITLGRLIIIISSSSSSSTLPTAFTDY